VLGVVPAPQLFDYDLEIGGRPFHQCPRRTQGFRKLLPEEDRVCDCGRARPTGVRLQESGVLFAGRTTRMALHARWRSSRRWRGRS
jgi:hypothetical protein